MKGRKKIKVAFSMLIVMLLIFSIAITIGRKNNINITQLEVQEADKGVAVNSSGGYSIVNLQYYPIVDVFYSTQDNNYSGFCMRHHKGYPSGYQKEYNAYEYYADNGAIRWLCDNMVRYNGSSDENTYYINRLYSAGVTNIKNKGVTIKKIFIAEQYALWYFTNWEWPSNTLAQQMITAANNHTSYTSNSGNATIDTSKATFDYDNGGWIGPISIGNASGISVTSADGKDCTVYNAYKSQTIDCENFTGGNIYVRVNETTKNNVTNGKAITLNINATSYKTSAYYEKYDTTKQPLLLLNREPTNTFTSYTYTPEVDKYSLSVTKTDERGYTLKDAKFSYKINNETTKTFTSESKPTDIVKTKGFADIQKSDNTDTIEIQETEAPSLYTKYSKKITIKVERQQKNGSYVIKKATASIPTSTGTKDVDITNAVLTEKTCSLDSYVKIKIKKEIKNNIVTYSYKVIIKNEKINQGANVTITKYGSDGQELNDAEFTVERANYIIDNSDPNKSIGIIGASILYKAKNVKSGTTFLNIDDLKKYTLKRRIEKSITYRVATLYADTQKNGVYSESDDNKSNITWEYTRDPNFQFVDSTGNNYLNNINNSVREVISIREDSKTIDSKYAVEDNVIEMDLTWCCGTEDYSYGVDSVGLSIKDQSNNLIDTVSDTSLDSQTWEYTYETNRSIIDIHAERLGTASTGIYVDVDIDITDKIIEGEYSFSVEKDATEDAKDAGHSLAEDATTDFELKAIEVNGVDYTSENFDEDTTYESDYHRLITTIGTAEKDVTDNNGETINYYMCPQENVKIENYLDVEDNCDYWILNEKNAPSGFYTSDDGYKIGLKVYKVKDSNDDKQDFMKISKIKFYKVITNAGKEVISNIPINIDGQSSNIFSSDYENSVTLYEGHVQIKLIQESEGKYKISVKYFDPYYEYNVAVLKKDLQDSNGNENNSGANDVTDAIAGAKINVDVYKDMYLSDESISVNNSAVGEITENPESYNVVTENKKATAINPISISSTAKSDWIGFYEAEAPEGYLNGIKEDSSESYTAIVNDEEVSFQLVGQIFEIQKTVDGNGDLKISKISYHDYYRACVNGDVTYFVCKGSADISVNSNWERTIGNTKMCLYWTEEGGKSTITVAFKDKKIDNGQYNIEVAKKSNTTDKYVANAEIQVIRNATEDETTVTTSADGAKKVYDENIDIKNLGSDKYVIMETKAPENYSLNTNRVEVTISRGIENVKYKNNYLCFYVHSSDGTKYYTFEVVKNDGKWNLLHGIAVREENENSDSNEEVTSEAEGREVEYESLDALLKEIRENMDIQIEVPDESSDSIDNFIITYYDDYNTFDFNIYKVIKGTEIPLNGATFDVKVTSNKKTDTIMECTKTSGEDGVDGKISIEKLAIPEDGEIYHVEVTETDAPEGYERNEGTLDCYLKYDNDSNLLVLDSSLNQTYAKQCDLAADEYGVKIEETPKSGKYDFKVTKNDVSGKVIESEKTRFNVTVYGTYTKNSDGTYSFSNTQDLYDYTKASTIMDNNGTDYSSAKITTNGSRNLTASTGVTTGLDNLWISKDNLGKTYYFVVKETQAPDKYTRIGYDVVVPITFIETDTGYKAIKGQAFAVVEEGTNSGKYKYYKLSEVATSLNEATATTDETVSGDDVSINVKVPNKNGSYDMHLLKYSTNGKKLSGVQFTVDSYLNGATTATSLYSSSNPLVTKEGFTQVGSTVDITDITTEDKYTFAEKSVGAGNNEYYNGIDGTFSVHVTKKLSNENYVIDSAYLTVENSSNSPVISSDKKTVTYNNGAEVRISAITESYIVIYATNPTKSSEGSYSVSLLKKGNNGTTDTSDDVTLDNVEFSVDSYLSGSTTKKEVFSKENPLITKSYNVSVTDGSVNITDTNSDVYVFTEQSVGSNNNDYYVGIKDSFKLTVNKAYKYEDTKKIYYVSSVSLSTDSTAATVKSGNKLVYNNGATVEVSIDSNNQIIINATNPKATESGEYIVKLQKTSTDGTVVSGVKFAIKSKINGVNSLLYPDSNENYLVTGSSPVNITANSVVIDKDTISTDDTYIIKEYDLGDNKNTYLKLSEDVTLSVKKQSVKSSDGSVITNSVSGIKLTTDSKSDSTYANSKTITLKDGNIVTASLSNGVINVTVKNKPIEGSYKLVLHKTNTAGEDLAGATFSITTDKSTGVYSTTGSRLLPATVTSDANGNIEIDNIKIDGIENYNITLTETSAPTGYEKLSEPIKVNIKTKVIGIGASEYYGIDTITEAESIKGVTVNKNADSNEVDINVTNYKFDLALRKSIAKIGTTEYSRNPVIDTTALANKTATTATYKHSKNPLAAAVGNHVVYTLNIYNEGEVDGYATEITDYLPEYLGFVSDSAINKANGWTIDSTGKIAKTTYLNNQLIHAYDEENDELEHKTVQIECEILSGAIPYQYITNIAEITAFTDKNGNSIVDRDSQANNANIPTGTSLVAYKNSEIVSGEATGSAYYIAGQQDDDDFEKVYVKENDGHYSLTLKKVDSTTGDAVVGAKFTVNGISRTTVTGGIIKLADNNITANSLNTEEYTITELDNAGLCKIKYPIKVTVTKGSVDGSYYGVTSLAITTKNKYGVSVTVTATKPGSASIDAIAINGKIYPVTIEWSSSADITITVNNPEESGKYKLNLRKVIREYDADNGDGEISAYKNGVTFTVKNESTTTNLTSGVATNGSSIENGYTDTIEKDIDKTSVTTTDTYIITEIESTDDNVVMLKYPLRLTVTKKSSSDGSKYILNTVKLEEQKTGNTTGELEINESATVGTNAIDTEGSTADTEKGSMNVMLANGKQATASLKVVYDENGIATITVEATNDKRSGEYSIAIKKVDAATGDEIEGATFAGLMYLDDETTSFSNVKSYSDTDDASTKNYLKQNRFLNNVKTDRYVIQEIKSPEGYIQITDFWLQATVTTEISENNIVVKDVTLLVMDNPAYKSNPSQNREAQRDIINKASYDIKDNVITISIPNEKSYSYDLKLEKRSSENPSTVLTGALFCVYEGNGEFTTLAKDSNGNEQGGIEASKIDIFNNNARANSTYTYTIAEVKAPDGYENPFFGTENSYRTAYLVVTVSVDSNGNASISNVELEQNGDTSINDTLEEFFNNDKTDEFNSITDLVQPKKDSSGNVIQNQFTIYIPDPTKTIDAHVKLNKHVLGDDNAKVSGAEFKVRKYVSDITGADKTANSNDNYASIKSLFDGNSSKVIDLGTITTNATEDIEIDSLEDIGINRYTYIYYELEETKVPNNYTTNIKKALYELYVGTDGKVHGSIVGFYVENTWQSYNNLTTANKQYVSMSIDDSNNTMTIGLANALRYNLHIMKKQYSNALPKEGDGTVAWSSMPLIEATFNISEVKNGTASSIYDGKISDKSIEFGNGDILPNTEYVYNITETEAYSDTYINQFDGMTIQLHIKTDNVGLIDTDNTYVQIISTSASADEINTAKENIELAVDKYTNQLTLYIANKKKTDGFNIRILKVSDVNSTDGSYTGVEGVGFKINYPTSTGPQLITKQDGTALTTDENGYIDISEEGYYGVPKQQIGNIKITGTTKLITITETSAPAGVTMMNNASFILRVDTTGIETLDALKADWESRITLSYDGVLNMTDEMKSQLKCYMDGDTIVVQIPNPTTSYEFDMQKVDGNSNLITNSDGYAASNFTVKLDSIKDTSSSSGTETSVNETVFNGELASGEFITSRLTEANKIYKYIITENSAKAGYTNILGTDKKIILYIATDANGKVYSNGKTYCEFKYKSGKDLVQSTYEDLQSKITLDVSDVEGKTNKSRVTLKIENPYSYIMNVMKQDLNGTKNLTVKDTAYLEAKIVKNIDVEGLKNASVAERKNYLKTISASNAETRDAMLINYGQLSTNKSIEGNSSDDTLNEDAQVWRIEEKSAKSPYINILGSNYVVVQTYYRNNSLQLITHKDTINGITKDVNYYVITPDGDDVTAEFSKYVEVSTEKVNGVWKINAKIKDPMQITVNVNKAEDSNSLDALAGAKIEVTSANQSKTYMIENGATKTDNIEEEVGINGILTYSIKEIEAPAGHGNVFENIQINLVFRVKEDGTPQLISKIFIDTTTGKQITGTELETLNKYLVVNSTYTNIQIYLKNPIGYNFELYKEDSDGNLLEGTEFKVVSSHSGTYYLGGKSQMAIQERNLSLANTVTYTISELHSVDSSAYNNIFSNSIIMTVSANAGQVSVVEFRCVNQKYALPSDMYSVEVVHNDTGFDTVKLIFKNPVGVDLNVVKKQAGDKSTNTISGANITVTDISNISSIETLASGPTNNAGKIQYHASGLSSGDYTYKITEDSAASGRYTNILEGKYIKLKYHLKANGLVSSYSYYIYNEDGTLCNDANLDQYITVSVDRPSHVDENGKTIYSTNTINVEIENPVNIGVGLIKTTTGSSATALANTEFKITSDDYTNTVKTDENGKFDVDLTSVDPGLASFTFKETKTAGEQYENIFGDYSVKVYTRILGDGVIQIVDKDGNSLDSYDDNYYVVDAAGNIVTEGDQYDLIHEYVTAEITVEDGLYHVKLNVKNPLTYKLNIIKKNASDKDLAGTKFTAIRNGTYVFGDSTSGEEVTTGTEVVERNVEPGSYTYKITENSTVEDSGYENILKNKFIEINYTVDNDGKVTITNDGDYSYSLYSGSITSVSKPSVDLSTFEYKDLINVTVDNSVVPNVINVKVVNPMKIKVSLTKMSAGSDALTINDVKFRITNITTGSEKVLTTKGQGNISFDEENIKAGTYEYKIEEIENTNGHYVNVLGSKYMIVTVKVSEDGTMTKSDVSYYNALTNSKISTSSTVYSNIKKLAYVDGIEKNADGADQLNIVVKNPTTIIVALNKKNTNNQNVANVKFNVTSTLTTDMALTTDDNGYAKFDVDEVIPGEYTISLDESSLPGKAYEDVLRGYKITARIKVNENGTIQIIKNNRNQNFTIGDGSTAIDSTVESEIIKHVRVAVTNPTNSKSRITFTIKDPVRYRLDIQKTNVSGENLAGTKFTAIRNKTDMVFGSTDGTGREVTTDVEVDERYMDASYYSYYITENSTVSNSGYVNILKDKFIRVYVKVDGNGEVTKQAMNGNYFELYQGDVNNVSAATELDLSSDEYKKYKDWISVDVVADETTSTDTVGIQRVVVKVVNPITIETEINKTQVGTDAKALENVKFKVNMIDSVNTSNNCELCYYTDENGKITFKKENMIPGTIYYKITELETANSRYTNIFADGKYMLVSCTLTNSGLISINGWDYYYSDNTKVDSSSAMYTYLKKYASAKVVDNKVVFDVKNPLTIGFKGYKTLSDGTVYGKVKFKLSNQQLGEKEFTTTEEDGTMESTTEFVEPGQYEFTLNEISVPDQSVDNILDGYSIKYTINVSADGTISFIGNNGYNYSILSNGKEVTAEASDYIHKHVSIERSITEGKVAYVIVRVSDPTNYILNIIKQNAKGEDIAGTKFTAIRDANVIVFGSADGLGKEVTTANEAEEHKIEAGDHTMYVTENSTVSNSGYVNILEGKFIKIDYNISAKGQISNLVYQIYEGSISDYSNAIPVTNFEYSDYINVYPTIDANNVNIINVKVVNPLTIKLALEKTQVGTTVGIDNVGMTMDAYLKVNGTYTNVTNYGTLTTANGGKIDKTMNKVQPGDYKFRITESKLANNKYSNIFLDGTKQVYMDVYATVSTDGKITVTDTKYVYSDDTTASASVIANIKKHTGVKISADSKGTNTILFEIENPLTIKFTTYKKTASGANLSGAVFTIANNVLGETRTLTTITNGTSSTTYTNVDPGTYDFEFKETKSPSNSIDNILDGYTIKYSVVVAGDGTISFNKDAVYNNGYNYYVAKDDGSAVSTQILDLIHKYVAIEINNSVYPGIVKVTVKDTVNYKLNILKKYIDADGEYQDLSGTKFTVIRAKSAVNSTPVVVFGAEDGNGKEVTTGIEVTEKYMVDNADYTYYIAENSTVSNTGFVNILEGKVIKVTVHVNKAGQITSTNYYIYNGNITNNVVSVDESTEADMGIYANTSNKKFVYVSSTTTTKPNVINVSVLNPITIKFKVSKTQVSVNGKIGNALDGVNFDVVAYRKSGSTYTSILNNNAVTANGGVISKTINNATPGEYLFRVHENDSLDAKYINIFEGGIYMDVYATVEFNGKITITKVEYVKLDDYDNATVITDSDTLDMLKKYTSYDVNTESSSGIDEVAFKVENPIQIKTNIKKTTTSENAIENVEFTVSNATLGVQDLYTDKNGENKFTNKFIEPGIYDYELKEISVPSAKIDNILEGYTIKYSVVVAEDGMLSFNSAKDYNNDYHYFITKDDDGIVSSEMMDLIHKYVTISLDNSNNDVSSVNVNITDTVNYGFDVVKLDEDGKFLDNTKFRIVRGQKVLFDSDDKSGEYVTEDVEVHEKYLEAGNYVFDVAETTNNDRGYINVLENKYIRLYMNISDCGVVTITDSSFNSCDGYFEVYNVDNTKLNADDYKKYVTLGVTTGTEGEFKDVDIITLTVYNPDRNIKLNINKKIFGDDEVNLKDVKFSVTRISKATNGKTVIATNVSTDKDGNIPVFQNRIEVGTYMYLISETSVPGSKFINYLENIYAVVYVEVHQDGSMCIVDENGKNQKNQNVYYLYEMVDGKADNIKRMSFLDTLIDDKNIVSVDQSEVANENDTTHAPEMIPELDVFVKDPEVYDIKIVKKDVSAQYVIHDTERNKEFLNGVSFDTTVQYKKDASVSGDGEEYKLVDPYSFEEKDLSNLVTANVNGEDGVILIPTNLIERSGRYTFTLHEHATSEKYNKISDIYYKTHSEDIKFYVDVTVKTDANGFSEYVVSNPTMIMGSRYGEVSTTAIVDSYDPQEIDSLVYNERITGTYDLVLNKTDKYTGEQLNGAVFEISVTKDGKDYQLWETDENKVDRIKTLIPDTYTVTDGVLKIPNIIIYDEETYVITLKEIVAPTSATAPNGYMLLDNPINIEVTTAVKGTYDDAEFVVQSMKMLDDEEANHGLVSTSFGDHNITLNVKNECFDLSLRKSIETVSYEDGTEDGMITAEDTADRIPDVDVTGLVENTASTAEYDHNKHPVRCYKSEYVVYTFRVYNEGEIDGYAEELTDYLPEYLEYVDCEFNNNNGWSYDAETNTVRTANLSKAYGDEHGVDNTIKARDPETGDLDYKEISIKCKVKDDVKAKTIINNIAEISKEVAKDRTAETVDRDSKTNNVDVPKDSEDMSNYKNDELDKSYIPGQEDDDDFEKLVVEEFDLALRKYITSIHGDEVIKGSNLGLESYTDEEIAEYEKEYNNDLISGSKENTDDESSDSETDDENIDNDTRYEREPIVDVTKLKSGEAQTADYSHSKVPLEVSVGDTVRYTLRVYNEGTVPGYASLIKDDIPEGMEFVTYTEGDGSINDKYGWRMVDANGNVVTDSKDAVAVVSSYLSKENESEDREFVIDCFDTENDTRLDSEYVEVEFKVVCEEDYAKILTNSAQIADDSDERGHDVKDRDSTPNEWKGEDDEDVEHVRVTYMDMALRKFITSVTDTTTNTTEDVTNRIPEVDSEDLKQKVSTTAKYNHTKEPVLVHTTDIVTYTLRVYNEGSKDGYAAGVKDDIPEGLEYLPENETNKEYEWVMLDENGNETSDVSKAVSIETKYLALENEQADDESDNSNSDETKDNLIKAFERLNGTLDTPDYRDVKVAFKVVEPTTSDRIVINSAQISKQTDRKGFVRKDRDSTPNEWKGEDDEDIEKVRVLSFDLALRKWVTQAITIKDGQENVTETGHHAEDDPEDVVKVDLKKSKIDDYVVKFRYSIRITNEGEIAGEATEISDYIPANLKFDQADNPDWREVDGKIVTDKLAGTTLQPGESAEVEVLLTWINGEQNMGVMINTAEISKDHNAYGTKDIDSTPNNLVTGEDDIDDAPVMLTVKTGSATIIILTIAIITMIGGATVIGFRRKNSK